MNEATRLQPRIIRCWDAETTGDPEPQEIVEVGWCDVHTYPDDPPECGDPYSILVEPTRPINPQARGVHHITDAELKGGLTAKAALLNMMTMGGVPDVLCAHNVKFEKALYNTDKRPWLCTMKAAMRIWPFAPDHRLQTLRYFLELDCDLRIATPAHRAGPDAYVNSLLLLKCLEHESVEQMISWTEQPSLLVICNLKKYKGKTWEEVAALDPDYCRWYLNLADGDEDVKFTIQHYMGTRQ